MSKDNKVFNHVLVTHKDKVKELTFTPSETDKTFRGDIKKHKKGVWLSFKIDNLDTK